VPGGVQTVAVGVNDDNGATDPAVAGPLPFIASSAYRFTPACSTTSTTNAAQYALTGNGAVFTNFAGTGFTVVSAASGPVLPPALRWLLPAALVLVALTFRLTRKTA
jgi:hypothetical protein